MGGRGSGGMRSRGQQVRLHPDWRLHSAVLHFASCFCGGCSGNGNTPSHHLHSWLAGLGKLCWIDHLPTLVFSVLAALQACLCIC